VTFQYRARTLPNHLVAFGDQVVSFESPSGRATKLFGGFGRALVSCFSAWLRARHYASRLVSVHNVQFSK